MNTTQLKTVGLLLALILTPHLHAHAQNAGAGKLEADSGGHTETIPIDSEPGLKAFVDAYIAARNAKDIEAVKSMHHPKDLQAAVDFVAHKPAAFDKLTLENMLLKAPVPQNHEPFTVKRYLPDSPLPGRGFTVFPVRPTHEVQCSYTSGPNSVGSFLVEVAREGDKWFVVNGVLSPDAIKKMTGGNAK
jgi:hypothetical protein